MLVLHWWCTGTVPEHVRMVNGERALNFKQLGPQELTKFFRRIKKKRKSDSLGLDWCPLYRFRLKSKSLKVIYPAAIGLAHTLALSEEWLRFSESLNRFPTPLRRLFESAEIYSESWADCIGAGWFQSTERYCYSESVANTTPKEVTLK